MADKRVTLALQLFHDLRRQCQILNKLEDKAKEYRGNAATIGSALCNFSTWRPKTILLDSREDTKKLWYVAEVKLKRPDLLDMRPVFLYGIKRVEARERVSWSLLVNAMSINLGPESQQYFREATLQEVEDIQRTLPIKKITPDYERI